MKKETKELELNNNINSLTELYQVLVVTGDTDSARDILKALENLETSKTKLN
jgi:hypothetical protein